MGNVLTETYLKYLEDASMMRKDIYDKCNMIEEDAFPALLKSLDPICGEIFKSFKVNHHHILTQLMYPEHLRSSFVERTKPS